MWWNNVCFVHVGTNLRLYLPSVGWKTGKNISSLRNALRVHSLLFLRMPHCTHSDIFWQNGLICWGSNSRKNLFPMHFLLKFSENSLSLLRKSPCLYYYGLIYERVSVLNFHLWELFSPEPLLFWSICRALWVTWRPGCKGPSFCPGWSWVAMNTILTEFLRSPKMLRSVL